MSVIHIVSHTHWDREWYQPFQVFRLRLVQLIDRLLDLLDSDPLYRYFMLDGQTILLEDYLAIRPEQEAKIRHYVQERRLVIGPWYILPDEFLVSPEATIRNLLEGERVCRRFGPKMRVGYIPDPFGHIGQMPQILKGFDIHAACFRRGLSDEPCELWWEAPDGSRVFTLYLREGYDNAASLPTSQPERCAREIQRLRDALRPFCASEHVLLMLGTDHMKPPPDTSVAIAWAQQHLEDDVRHSTLSDYLIAVQSALAGKDLPKVRGELRSPKRHHLLPGVLSTRIWIKQHNHACETLLEKWVEPFSTFASLLTAESGTQTPDHRLKTIAHRPQPIVREAWRLLMQCHPHDSICGCSIDEVHDEMRSRFNQVEQIGEELTRQSLTMLAGEVNTQRILYKDKRENAKQTKQNARAVVVFNPSSFTRTDIVALETSLSDIEIMDDEGNVLPSQILDSQSQDYVNLVCDAAMLRSLFGSIRDGQAGNLNIQAIRVRREGHKVFIHALVSEEQSPNIAAWQEGLQEIEQHVQDAGVQEYHVRASGVGRVRLMFVAPQVPGLGYRTFRLRPKTTTIEAGQRLPGFARFLLPLARLPLIQRLIPRPHRRARPPYCIENEFLHVSVAKDGTLTLTDKRDGRVYPGLHRFVDGGDCGDEYNYAPPPKDRLTTARLRWVEAEHGAVRQMLTLHLEIKVPVALTADRRARGRQCTALPITSTIVLTNGIPRLDIHTEIENRARDHRLRVHFPAPFATDHAAYDGHFEIVKRSVETPFYDETWVEHPRPESPQRAFTAVHANGSGLLIANRGLPEVAVLKQSHGDVEIALTLLRCVGWLSRDDFSTRRGHAGPMIETPGAQMLGVWAFDYAILVGEDCRSPYLQAYSFNVPLRVAETDLHDGFLPPCQSFVEVAPQEFMISAVKTTEDGTGWLVRGYNLGEDEIWVQLKPWRPFRRAARLNLAEQEIAPLPIAADGSLSFTARGHEIVTVKFEG